MTYNWNISSLARYGKASFVFFVHSQSRLPHPFSSSDHLLTLYKLFILCVSFIMVHLCKSCVQIYGDGDRKCAIILVSSGVSFSKTPSSYYFVLFREMT